MACAEELFYCNFVRITAVFEIYKKGGRVKKTTLSSLMLAVSVLVLPVKGVTLDLDLAIDQAKLIESQENFIGGGLNATISENEELLRSFRKDLYTIHSTDQGTFLVDRVLRDHIKHIFIKQGRVWEKKHFHLIKAFTREGSIAVDVGAHVGTHTTSMSRSVGEGGWVIAFEPQKKVFAELFFNMHLSGCKNVITLRKAVGNVEKTVYLGPVNPVNEGARFIVEEKTNEEVPMVTLDSLNLSNVSFIKIDSENMDLEILEGAEETIKRNRPIMIIEVQGNIDKERHDKVSMAEKRKLSIKKIKGLGYAIFSVGDFLCFPVERMIK